MAKKNVLTHSKKKKALVLLQNNQFAEARTLYAQVCTIDKRDAEAWFLLGSISGQMGNAEEALECFRQVVALSPGHALAHYNLGMALRRQGRLEEAVQALREAARLDPQRADIHIGLAHTYVDLNQPEGAAICYRELVKLRPDDADMHFNLGMMLHVLHRLEDAVRSYRKSLQLKSSVASVYDNLGSAYCEQGKYAEALTCHRQALQLNPGDDKSQSNILMTLLYLPEADPREVFSEHRRWGQTHVHPSADQPIHANSRDSERRLRIGYVSPDFRTHSVAYFFEPLLANHDCRAVETVCYSTAARTDATTERLRGLADQWRDISGLGAGQVADMIRSDAIDILVDLAGHTAGNRLRVFACKPAPVQATYLGYPNTTGLSAIDYRLTDVLSDPPGQEVFYTEKLIRLPDGFLCYQPPVDSPMVAPLPASTAGHVTFGSFNNLAKINPQVVVLWAKLLQAIPDARLLIKNSSLTDTVTRERYHVLFEEHGVSRDRVELLGHTPALTEHLALYSRLDIALDTFPYNGTTTTCEALWMGVPVITLAGSTHAGRVGVSLLNNNDLKEWIAETPEQYISLAAGLANDTQRLAALRTGLREHLTAFPLCDGKAFARKVEAAYRDIWRCYCAS